MDLCGVSPLLITNPEQAILGKHAWGTWAIKGRQYKWDLPPDALLVFDECHRYKNRTTKTAKLMVAAGRQGIKTFAASATAAKDPMDMYALGLLLGLHNGPDFAGFCFQYGMVRGGFDFKFSGDLKALQKLHGAIFPEHGYRATYDEIPGFPENTIVPLGVNVADAKELDSLWDRVRELQVLQETAPQAAVERLRARQKAELLKVPAFLELIQDHLDEDMSVVVFVNFKDTIEALRATFPKAALVVGGQSTTARQAYIDEFQRDERRVMICQAQAGGVGIDAHDTRGIYPRVSLISPPESAILLIQILGRIRRTGAKSPALQKIVFAENTIEVRVRRAVEKKVGQIDVINDGDLDPLKAS